MTTQNITKLFNLGRKVDIMDTSNKYLYFANRYKLDNYKLISSGELLIRGKGLDIPEYIKQFISFNKEVLMIADIYGDKVINIIFRTLGKYKEFIKLGRFSGVLYGLGQLDKDFKYGDPIIIVEGNLDRDVMSQLVNKNVLGASTSTLSLAQVQTLSYLTNNYILMLDNDEAGIQGSKNAYYKLKKNGKVYILNHHRKLKDAGDLVDLMIRNDSELEYIINLYKNKVL